MVVIGLLQDNPPKHLLLSTKPLNFLHPPGMRCKCLILTQRQDIHLITPPSSSKAIEAALSQIPSLTSLPLPKPDILAPEGLSQNTGTAEILRLPEVQVAITGDFLILPCDLVCEVAGESLLEAWMIEQSGLGGAAASSIDYLGPKIGLGGEKGGRRGGLGVWFQTKGEESVKGEETDFVITTSLPQPNVPPPEGSARSNMSKVLFATTTDTLRDITEEKKGFPIRHGLIRKHGKIRMLANHRDAHAYFFPHWVLEFVKRNEKFDSISEDVVGWWAKAGWQDGLPNKLSASDIFDRQDDPNGGEVGSNPSDSIEDEVDLASLSTTYTSKLHIKSSNSSSIASQALANSDQPSERLKPQFPPMFAYVHPSTSPTPLIRRVDTPALLLSTSLYIATQRPADPSSPSTPYSHPSPYGTTTSIAPQTTITNSDCLLGPNTTVETHAVIKATVVGANCHIKKGARLTRCLLMDEVVIGEKAQLTGCVIGKMARVEGACVLGECQVQPRYVVNEGTEAKGEVFMISGLDDLGDEEMAEGDGEVLGDEDNGLSLV